MTSTTASDPRTSASRATYRPAPDLRLELFSQPRLLCAAREAIGALAQRIGFARERADHICLAVDETLSNVINHGYERRSDGRIWVSIWLLTSERPGLRIIIEDEAPHVELDCIRPRRLDDVRPGGLGVHIIQHVMDEVTYAHRQPRGMLVEMWAWIREDQRPGTGPAGPGAGDEPRAAADDDPAGPAGTKDTTP